MSFSPHRCHSLKTGIEFERWICRYVGGQRVKNKINKRKLAQRRRRRRRLAGHRLSNAAWRMTSALCKARTARLTHDRSYPISRNKGWRSSDETRPRRWSKFERGEMGQKRNKTNQVVNDQTWKKGATGAFRFYFLSETGDERRETRDETAICGRLTFTHRSLLLI